MQDFEELITGQKKRNPLVLVGAAATAGVLGAGLIAFRQGNSQLSQRMMRARVLFQGITVSIMAGSAGFMALQDKQKGPNSQ